MTNDSDQSHDYKAEISCRAPGDQVKMSKEAVAWERQALGLLCTALMTSGTGSKQLVAPEISIHLLGPEVPKGPAGKLFLDAQLILDSKNLVLLGISGF